MGRSMHPMSIPLSTVTGRADTYTQVPNLHVDVPFLDLLQIESDGGYHVRAKLVCCQYIGKTIESVRSKR
jgi:hypothetical protein